MGVLGHQKEEMAEETPSNGKDENKNGTAKVAATEESRPDPEEKSLTPQKRKATPTKVYETRSKKARLTPTKDEQLDEEDPGNIVSVVWSEDAIQKKEEDTIFYKSVKVNDKEYKIGDVVEF